MTCDEVKFVRCTLQTLLYPQHLALIRVQVRRNEACWAFNELRGQFWLDDLKPIVASHGSCCLKRSMLQQIFQILALPCLFLWFIADRVTLEEILYNHFWFSTDLMATIAPEPLLMALRAVVALSILLGRIGCSCDSHGSRTGTLA